jgi:hypothetical protein
MKYSQVLTQSFYFIPTSVILRCCDTMIFASILKTLPRESRDRVSRGVERDTETESESFAEVLTSLNAVISK